ncbi:MAG: DUF58 domain-containing protein [Aquabacterium sp.]|nr:DUF58 domain-containing protein [Aquabacterium sp.]
MGEHDRSTADALLRRLEWTVLRRLDGLLQGDHRTLWRGGGLDLADLREYQHGDDVRHIDWNVTARLQVPHVRQYTDDRDLTAWFLVDLTGSIEFGSAERTKREVAEELVALLARLITRHGNRVGALLYGLDGAGQPPRLVPPGTGRRQVLALASRLRESAAPGARVTVLGDLLRAAEGVLRRRSLVFVVSDFISEPGWDDALGRLARRHEVMALRLYDPLEMTLPDLGLLTLADAETGEQLQVDTADPGFRRRFEALAGQTEHALREALARAGVDTLEVTTADDLLTTVLRYAALRRQRLRARPAIGMPADLAPARPTVEADATMS